MKTPRLLVLTCAATFVVNAFAQSSSPGFRLKGTVVDAAGKPVDAATIESYSYPRASIFGREDMESKERVVATNGGFELDLPGWSTLVVARKPGLAPAWRQFWNVSSDMEERFMLGQPGSLAGTVVEETDKPVANAEVSVAIATMEIESAGGSRTMGYLSGKAARDYFSARTASDGRFRLENFPTNAAAELTVRVAGKAIRQTQRQSWDPSSLSCRAGQEDIRLVVEPAGSVQGKVVLEGSEQSPPVARLMLQPEAGFYSVGGSGNVESSADGAFRFSDLAAGNYQLRAEFGTNAVPDWTAETVPVSVESGQTTTGVEIKATRGGLLAVGVVSQKDKQPLAQVAVNVFRQNFQSGALTDTAGKAFLRLPPGDYQVAAQRDGMNAANTSATIEAGKTNSVEMELPSPVKIVGVIRDPKGQPAAGLEVRIVGSYMQPGKAQLTDANGKFELPFNPRQFAGMPDRVYCLLARDASRNLAVAQEVDEDTGPLELRLAPGLTLVGRVECEGKPVTNANVALVFWAGNSGMHLQGLGVGTNTPGRFEIPALPLGHKYGLSVLAAGFGQKYVNATESEDEPKRLELDPVELKLANLRLAGQVVDAEDKPVAGASVHLSGENQPAANARTDREGRFSFSQVCEGSVRLFANARNAQGNVSAEGGDTNVVLRLGESSAYYSGSTTRKLKGVVTDPEGKPVAGAQVAAFPSQMSWIKTGADGGFTLNWRLEPWQLQSGGDPWLMVRDLKRDLAAAETISEDATNFNVRLKQGMTVTGRVEGPDGVVLTNAPVGVWLVACRSQNQLNAQPARTDAQGNFELKTLASGPQYILYASAKDHGRQQQELSEDTATNRVELPPFQLKLADKTIAGQVVNTQEKPVSGAHVSLSGDDQPQGSVTTDSKGRFSFKVCEGQIRLFANAQNSFSSTTVEAGDTNIVMQVSDRGMAISGQPRPSRASLKGRPLPDLSAFGLSSEAASPGKPLLVCLLDAEQRPSRRSARLLAEQHDGLRQKGIAVVAIQAAVASAEMLRDWTNSAPLPFALGCVTDKSPATHWVTSVESLPWLILRDAKGNVADEGFSLDELDAKIGALKE